jgi:stearoyl-CoA desaturase (delta-9 desaturase)
MGPLHGAIVNWCGHKYGYSNLTITTNQKIQHRLIFDAGRIVPKQSPQKA